ncbi:Putative HTH-type transcriptional regulator [Anaerolineae bacterium]|nr:Putative HTH-type transcriptional regulator [Anaerolineae bacterium]
MEKIPTEWSTFFAVLCLLVLAIFLYRWLRRSSRPREREFNNALTHAPLIIGKAKWDMLTPRQQQVARLAARGLSNSEIAQQLDIKPNTVDAHLKKIYAALDVHSRTELSYKIRDQLD